MSENHTTHGTQTPPRPSRPVPLAQSVPGPVLPSRTVPVVVCVQCPSSLGFGHPSTDEDLKP